MNIFTIFVSCFLLSAFVAFSQTIQISGTVSDKETGESLQFANVWVDGTSKGTTTDKNGRYSIYLDPGSYTILASYIGYKSARTFVAVGAQSIDLPFRLASTSINMPEVVVTPGDNPALKIIRLAIENKKKQKEKLLNYRLTSHSKLTITAKDIKGMQINNISDSSFMAILETQTDAYWAKPDRYKEIIKARKQTSFIPSQANIMISSFFIIDFSADNLKFTDKPIVGPISEAGLRNYYYRLTGTIDLDGAKIFIIEISPLYENDPLLQGTLYIAEGSYSLAMVDVKLTESALPTFFKNIAFKQHFRLFDDIFWMPVDVVVDANVEISLIMTIKLAIEGFSVLQDYILNEPSVENFFDRTRIKILKEADERDSLYWAQNQKIPNTMEELDAYRKADSIKMLIDSVRNDYGIMNIFTGKNFFFDPASVNVPGIMSMYRFNRVDGHSLRGAFSAHKPFFPIERISIETGYGFNSNHWTYNLSAGFLISQTPRVNFSATLFERLNNLYEENSLWSDLETTLSSILIKYDYKDYFRSKGWGLSLNADILMLFPTTMSYTWQRQYSAFKTTDWSLFRRDWLYRENPPINEGTIHSYALSVSFDGRDFIDNAGIIRRFGRRFHIPYVKLEYNKADLLGDSFEFTTFTAGLRGNFDLGQMGTFAYRLSGDLTHGKLPTQRLFDLYGSVPFIADKWRFRTLDMREFGGDKRLMACVEHNFGDLVFRRLGIPYLESADLDFIVFGECGWTSMSAETRMLQTIPVREAKRPFYEIGFGIDNIFLLFRLDLAWRLNHFSAGRNFFIGISTPLL